MTLPNVSNPPRKVDARFDDWIIELWRRVRTTLTASDISDFQTAVSANTDVAANTAARHAAATVLDTDSVDLTISGQQISASVKQMNLSDIMAFAAAHG